MSIFFKAKIGSTISMPLHWDEVKRGLTMRDFTIKNAVKRVRTEGDLFKEILGKGIDMAAALEKAQSLFIS